MTVTRNHYVVRLEIAMHDAGSMSFSESFCDVLQVAQQLPQIGLTENGLAESLPIDEFHRDEICALALANLIDMGDVRMIERGRGLCLLFETPHPITIGGHVRRQNFQCDFAMKLCIFRQIHFTHSALANL